MDRIVQPTQSSSAAVQVACGSRSRSRSTSQSRGDSGHKLHGTGCCIGHSARGTTLVEFAFVLPMFVLLLFAVADFARLFYIEMTLQNAVREAGRDRKSVV